MTRTPLDLEIDIAWHEMHGRAGDARLLWARRYVEAKARRGDYRLVIQGELGEDLLAALARHEAGIVAGDRASDTTEKKHE